MILLGDCELRVPLAGLASLFAVGWDVDWILGNKDTETETCFRTLTVDFPEGDWRQSVPVDGSRIAAWRYSSYSSGPRDEPPSFSTRGEFLGEPRSAGALARGLPLWTAI